MENKKSLSDPLVSPKLPLVGRWKKRFDKRVEHIRKHPIEFVRSLAILIGVAGSAWVVWLSLQPKLIFADTTATGGDMGAHVWWPAFMRDFLLPSGRVFGWTMDYYSGFPAGQYYFPVPAIMVVLLDVVLPYNVAFKLVTVLGSVFLPVGAYVLGRSIKAPKPIPLIMAFAATAFLYFTGDPRTTSTAANAVNYENANFNQHIMGGPLLSAMAGEFSFSIALTFGLLFLGVFYIWLRESKRPALVAVLFALTVLSHLVVAIFIGIAALAFWGASYLGRKGITKWVGYALIAWVLLFGRYIGSIGRYFFDKKVEPQLFYMLTATVVLIAILVYGYLKDRAQVKSVLKDALPLIVGFLLSSIWLIPLLMRFDYTSNMRYEKLGDLATTPGVNEVYELYISPNYFVWPVFIPAAIGFLLSAAFLRRSIIPVFVTTIVMGTVFVKWPEGHAWNLRFLPFYYLFMFFLAAVGYGEILRLPSVILAHASYSVRNRSLLMTSQILRAGITVVLVMVFFVCLVGFGSPKRDSTQGCGSTQDLRFFKDRRGYAHSWAKYNFEGYERKPAADPCAKDNSKHKYTTYNEFKALMDKMDTLDQGRALWEPSDGTYGTTLALMMLPYYTDHKIASQEGLYYEAAGSTAYHFLTVAEVSQTPSNPMRWPKCDPNIAVKDQNPECVTQDYGTIADFTRGVTHMQMMGVKYYLAQSQEAKTAAQANGDLKLVGQVADRDGLAPFGWDIFEVKKSSLVEPLAVDPVVVTDKTEPADWAQSGNKWLHDWFNTPGEYRVFVDGGPDAWTRKTAKQALNDKLSAKDQQKKSSVKVSNVELKQDSIKFHVDKVGEPVLVKVSYYPTFRVSGAKAIYRASPNSMVVIPESNDVKIEMKRDGIEWLSLFLFFTGIGGVVALKLHEKKKLGFLSDLLRSRD